ncbi:glycosyltransferase [Achromobacter xylosoxidans]|jgi:glycosyltransferase involved in cell wall biosynthesis|uniref:glycosyltransferase n=1 Tax=Alcaligenes xylosoxydans xylosoxydans TaxID=85698 RepID=UPI00071DD1F6|nr:glycosyltransferase [Achromobacter xylosoxidans]ELQ7838772.1 glycosyltransferase [Pseudomonas aeruginosa]MDH0519510.1 glycosyltransferase [Achromobacter xylosoxidans]MDH0543668.1 glycosyltransferase [Achromobacter xylosoxidans]QKQ54408.1 glycosyltransferase [Achromobacter xylosoxidans]QPR96438.1 glycosyltransferase [Achromobacter xylosoxidans]
MSALTSRPLRVIHSEAATGFGGQEHRVLKEMRGMRDRGHHMEAICQPGSGLSHRLTDEGFKVYTLPMDGPVNYVRSLYRIRRLLAAGRYDVINTHSRRDTVIAAAAARLAGTPLIVRTRHLAKPPGSLWSYTGLPHKVIAISEYVTRQLLARGVRPGDLDTVFTAVAPFAPATQSTLRAELHIKGDALVVGCVGHLRPQKGHRLLLTAIAPLLTGRADNHLVAAGEGSELESLKEQARALGCEGRVHFLGRRNDIENVLCGCDIFALATEFEALGTSFIEAAASGLPVVATSVGGVPEVVKHGQTGLLVPYGDVHQLRDAIGVLMADRALRERMGKAGEAYIRGESKFTIGGMSERVEAAYMRWLAG